LYSLLFVFNGTGMLRNEKLSNIVDLLLLSVLTGATSDERDRQTIDTTTLGSSMQETSNCGWNTRERESSGCNDEVDIDAMLEELNESD
jgi:hypothetical protein